jgi:flagellar biosynthesis protein FlhF
VNVKRFFGRTNKDALAKLRAEFGADAVVLRNRAVDGGVEILAMPDSAGASAEPGRRGLPPPAANPMNEVESGARDRQTSPAGKAGRVGRAESADGPATAVPEMNTLSFQQYVRDRLARRAEQSDSDDPGGLPEPAAAGEPPVRAASGAEWSTAQRQTRASSAATRAAGQAGSAMRATTPDWRFERDGLRTTPSTSPAPSPMPVTPAAVAAALGDARESITEAIQSSVLGELRQMKDFIAGQLEALSWLEGTRRQPVRNRLLRSLMVAGLSPVLSRALVSRLPEGCTDDLAATWVRKALIRNLRTDPSGAMIESGGVFAIVGPTGVGKTTSTAKIAARFALRHGTQSIGLVTVDAYRVGGQDQLRSFGRMLGVPVHVAHDAPSLQDFLQLYENKKLVLIDTAGISQRDARVDELLDSLAGAGIGKLLVVNAASHVETLEEVVHAYRGNEAAGMIISKLDEAVRPGAALDCAIRHKIRVVGLADGQRVPEDWHWADPRALVDKALSVPASPAFEFDEEMLGMMFAGVAGIGGGRGRSADV